MWVASDALASEQDFTRSVVKDTSVLMAASATWYGIQVGRLSRHHASAVNGCLSHCLLVQGRAGMRLEMLRQ
jgi:hypothetical protein